MLPKDEHGNELYRDVVDKFIKSGAVSKEKAVDYCMIGINPGMKESDKQALNYLRVMNILKKYKGKLYLDEDALQNPKKAYAKKILFQTLFCAPFIIVLFLVMFLMWKFN